MRCPDVVRHLMCVVNKSWTRALLRGNQWGNGSRGEVPRSRISCEIHPGDRICAVACQATRCTEVDVGLKLLLGDLARVSKSCLSPARRRHHLPIPSPIHLSSEPIQAAPRCTIRGRTKPLGEPLPALALSGQRFFSSQKTITSRCASTPGKH